MDIPMIGSKSKIPRGGDLCKAYKDEMSAEKSLEIRVGAFRCKHIIRLTLDVGCRQSNHPKFWNEDQQWVRSP
jgi:hypothetical protein